MTYIYKTGRIELFEQIKSHSHYLHGKILDIGAGNFSRYKNLFNFTEYVKMDTEQRTGVDIVGKIEAIPVENASFDSIVCTQVLGDVFELNEAFKELNRILRPKGVLLVTENLFDSIHDEPNDYWRFTEYSLRRLAKEAGFEIVILERRGGFRSVMAQMQARYWIERLNANEKWYARILSFIFRLRGERARRRDQKDTSKANTIFTHGYLLIAKKHA